MGKIKILPEHEARKVAAGEVIERPVNIVKELVENSLDAHARTISIYLEKAGKQLIRVMDDGCGMAPDDALLAVKAHATSKITSIHDLVSIDSFGFRGEALASVVAVSEFRLKTWDGIADTLGSLLSVNYGHDLKAIEIACPKGTDIEVRNLFSNIPVRKKFLKQDETEWNHVVQLVQAFALSHQTIHFKLFHDDKLVHNLPPADNVKTRVSQLWGYNFAENMITLQETTTSKHAQWLQVTGCISNHNFWRYNRNAIFFFVNNRWVKHQEFSKALLKGYANVLPSGRFPAAFIFITVSKEQVDINVHPKKEEVRFMHPLVVYKDIQDRTKTSLEKALSHSLVLKQHPVTEDKLHDAAEKVLADSEVKQAPAIKQPSLPPVLSHKQPVENLFSKPFPSVEASPLKGLNFKKEVLLPSEESQTPVDSAPMTALHVKGELPFDKEVIEGVVVGQLFKTYILLEQHDKMMVIDQHAAHERILYERFRRNFGSNEGTRLLFPIVFTLSEQELSHLLEHKKIFAQHGIECDQVGKQELVIKSSPSGLRGDYILKELLLEAVGFIQENLFLDEEALRQKLTEHMHSQMACKAAVKAGDELTQDQIKSLLKDLSLVENRFICAHGRPTTWFMSKREIEKHFRRC